MDLDTKRATKLTDMNPELRNFALGDLKPVKWRSFDGFEIWGLLLTPPDATPGAKLPLVVYCHGGPGGGVTYGIFPQFMHIRGQVDPYPAEAMASARDTRCSSRCRAAAPATAKQDSARSSTPGARSTTATS